MDTPGFPVHWDAATAVVTMPPEVDIANERQVDEELGALLGLEPRLLVADMTRTRFCDSSGVAALIRAAKRARTLKIEFRVAGPRTSIRRVLEVTGADQVVDIYPSLAAARRGRTQPD